MKYLKSFLLFLIIFVKAMKSNIIMVKINGTGTQKFIKTNCPNETYFMNGTKIGNNICQTEFEKQENTILLKWYNQITGNQLFARLKNIIEINFLDCTMSQDMHGIFEGCSNLKSINFTGLHVVSTSGNTLNNAFRNCISLTSLDLSMVFPLKRDFRNIFNGCKNLEYINIITYDESNVQSGWYINFDNVVPNNLVICINETLAPILKSNLTNRGCTIIYCGKNWREKQKNIIKETNNCIDTCQNTDIYKYEYNNKCLTQCPDGTIKQNYTCFDKEIVRTEIPTEIKKSSLIEISTEQKFFESTNLIISTQINIDIKSSNIISNESKSLYNESYLVYDEIIMAKDKKISELKENIMSGDLDDILKNITENNEDFIQKDEDNTLFQITTTENQKSNKNNNISTINFGTCENKLRKVYQINETLPLIIFKIDYYPSDLLIPIIAYEVYHPINKSKLDLSYCEDILVELNIPVSIDEDNLFKYNPESDYYTDNCFSYTTENGTDIILSDRQQEFKDNNLSLCENKCNYIGYNQTNKQSSCNCTVKNKIDLISEIIVNPDKLSNNFNSSDSPSSSSNIIIMKCVKNLFTKEGIKNNISSYILIFIILFFMFSITIFIKCGFPFIKKDIEQILKHKYIEEKNKKNKKTVTKRKRTFPVNRKNKNKIFTNNFPPKRKIKIGNIHNNRSSNFRIRPISNNNLSLNLRNNKRISNINNTNRIKINNNIKKAFNPNVKKKKIKENYNIFELNALQYKNALNTDKRKCCKYYTSLLRIKHPFIFAFCPMKDYNSRIIKICLFLLSFAIFYAINFAFFDEKILHKIYEDKGKYDIIYFLPKISISFIAGHLISIILNYIFLSERNIIKIKEQNTYSKADYTAQNVQKKLVIKYVIFFILGNIFLGFFWILLSSFGAVYQNTQIFLVKNTLISFSMDLVYPFFYNIFPCFFRMISLNSKSECFYNFSKFLQLL